MLTQKKYLICLNFYLSIFVLFLEKDIIFQQPPCLWKLRSHNLRSSQAIIFSSLTSKIMWPVSRPTTRQWHLLAESVSMVTRSLIKTHIYKTYHTTLIIRHRLSFCLVILTCIFAPFIMPYCQSTYNVTD